MAGSGSKKVVYNTRERLLSLDHNREQAFEAADIASVLARAFLPVYADDRGVSTLDETKAAPLTALILDGLMLRPIDGTASALVDPGTVVMSDPDASPSGDDVPWKWVHSDGIVAAGELVLTTNPGGVRIDVVEFSRTEEVVEYDSRDQFDPGTGLFTPVPVEKVRRGALVFRIRLGVVGSSFPGVVAGWVPIAVIRVPAVATTWDVVTVWDVRPLLADRRAGAANVQHLLPRVTRQVLKSDVFTAPAETRVAGMIEGELLGWRVGGELDTSAPGTQPGYFDVTEIDNQEGSGVTFDASKHWYLYLLFPYGLPAWRRYSEPGVGGRVPNGQRGIAVASKKVPRFTGRPSATIYPSNSTDLQNGTFALETHPTLCVAVGRVDAAMRPLGLLADGRVAWTIFAVFDDAGATLAAAVTGATQAEFTPIAGTHFPDNARAVYATFSITVTATGAAVWGAPLIVRATDETGTLANVAAPFVDTNYDTFTYSNGSSVLRTLRTRIPLAHSLDESAPRQFKFILYYGAIPANLAVSSPTVLIEAWEIGD